MRDLVWFVSSYAPLWLMLALRFDDIYVRVGLALLAFGSIGSVARILTRLKDEYVTEDTIAIDGNAGADVGGYLASYLLPFLVLSKPTGWDVAAYIVFIAVAGLVYVRSGLIQINPTVYLLGWRIFRGTIAMNNGNTEIFVISRRDLRGGTELHGERFADRVYIDHKKGR